MAFRAVVPVVHSQGFGNLFNALIRAHLISDSCGLRFYWPRWPIRQRVPWDSGVGLGRYRTFGGYFPDRLRDRVVSDLSNWHLRLQRRLHRTLVWPVVEFSRDVAPKGRSHWIEDDGEACRSYLERQGLLDSRRSVTVLVGSGDLSRYRGIRRGRKWLVELMIAHRETRELIDGVEREVGRGFRVGLLVRMGDYVERGETTVDGVRTEPSVIVPGERNVRLPIEWFIRIGEELRRDGPCRFVLVSDGTEEELKPILEAFSPSHVLGKPFQDLAGAVILSRCDLVISSNSTYSRLAVFLSEGRPYIWPAETLYPDDCGRFGYLWNDKGRRPRADDWGEGTAVRRCFALSVNFRSLPDGLLRYKASDGMIPVEIVNDLLYREPVQLLMD